MDPFPLALEVAYHPFQAHGKASHARPFPHAVPGDPLEEVVHPYSYCMVRHSDQKGLHDDLALEEGGHMRAEDRMNWDRVEEDQMDCIVA